MLCGACGYKDKTELLLSGSVQPGGGGSGCSLLHCSLASCVHVTAEQCGDTEKCVVEASEEEGSAEGACSPRGRILSSHYPKTLVDDFKIDKSERGFKSMFIKELLLKQSSLMPALLLVVQGGHLWAALGADRPILNDQSCQLLVSAGYSSSNCSFTWKPLINAGQFLVFEFSSNVIML